MNKNTPLFIVSEGKLLQTSFVEKSIQSGLLNYI